VLESAGLVKVVRTRKVRALTESFYGRTARLFVLKVAEEGEHLRVRLSPADAAAFHARLVQFRLDLAAAEAPGGDEYELIASLYPVGGYS
jgi:hypothetical protein